MKSQNKRKKRIRRIVFMLTGVLLLQQPMTVAATGPSAEDTTIEDGFSEEEQELQYIMDITPLSDDGNYFGYYEKLEEEELISMFPETIEVLLKDADETTEIPVTWECEVDYENEDDYVYLFYPKWDGALYELDESVADVLEMPYILVEILEDDNFKLISDIDQAKSDLEEILEEKSVIGLIYLCDTCEVREEAGEDAECIATVESGQSVIIKDVELDEYGQIWYKILLYEGGKEYSGYIERSYLATSDAEFLDWEQEHIRFEFMPMLMMSSRTCPDIEQFPASYRNALYALKEQHPNWTFVRMNTKIDWNYAIANENKNAKNLVQSSRPASWRNGNKEPGWDYASEAIIRYYMDPRNFLTDPYIYQFEQLTYNPTYHTVSAVQGILNGSFMASVIPGDVLTYAQAFEKIGSELGVSPFHLASRVYQEQGAQGTSPLISGTYSGYQGYYNYFNVGASGKTTQEIIVNGLNKAVQQGWNTRYKSLYGGAKVIGSYYILRGQDTLYLEKFNVSNGYYPNFEHQYMQNLEAPYYESKRIRKAYYDVGVIDNPFVFKIPVYDNMPASPCPKPDTAEQLSLNKTSVDALKVDQYTTITPYINGAMPDSYNGITFTSSDASVASVDANGKIKAISPGYATITCSYAGKSATCSVTVVKGSYTVSSPTVSPVAYRNGLTLRDVALPDGWAWEKEGTALGVGTSTQRAIYTAADSSKYETVLKDVTVTVTKAIPAYTAPSAMEVDEGTTLGSLSLPAGYTWESDPSTVLDTVGEITCYVTYNPDESLYYPINHIPVTITVYGKILTPGEPEDPPSTSTGSGAGNITIPSKEDISNGGGSGTGGIDGDGSISSSGGNPADSGISSSAAISSSTVTSNAVSSSAVTSGGTVTSSAISSSAVTSSGTVTSSAISSSAVTSSGAVTSNAVSSSAVTSGSTVTSSAISSSAVTSGSTVTSSAISSSTVTSSGTITSSTVSSSAVTSSIVTSSSEENSNVVTPSKVPPNETSSGTASSVVTSSANTGSVVTPSKVPSAVSSSGITTSSSSATSSGAVTSSVLTSSAITSVKDPVNSQTNIPQSPVVSSVQSAQIQSQTSTQGQQTAVVSSQTSQGQQTQTTQSQAGTQFQQTQPVQSQQSQGVQPQPSQGQQAQALQESQPVQTDNPVQVTSPNEVNAQPAKADETNTTKSESTQTKGEEPYPSMERPVFEGTVNANVPEQDRPLTKPSVTISMQETTVLTKDTIAMMREQNLDIVLEMEKGIRWKIDADTIDENFNKSVDMGVHVVQGVIPKDLLQEQAAGGVCLEISLAHEGDFGFTPVLEVSFAAEYIGKYANLFYYNPKAGQLELLGNSLINENGVATLTFTHASDYLVTITDQPVMAAVTNPDSGSVLQKWIWIILAVLFMLLAIGIGVCFLRRQDDSEEEFEEDESEEEESEQDEFEAEESEEDKSKEDKPKREVTKKKKDGDNEYFDEEDDEYDAFENHHDALMEKHQTLQSTPFGEKDQKSMESVEIKHSTTEEDDWIDDDEWESVKPKETVETKEEIPDDDEWISDEEWEQSEKHKADKRK